MERQKKRNNKREIKEERREQTRNWRWMQMVKRRSPGEMFAFKVSEGSPCLASSSTNKPQRFWEDKNSPATVSLTPKNERQHERRVEIILRGLKRVVVSLQRQRKKDHHLLKEMRSCFICWTVVERQICLCESPKLAFWLCNKNLQLLSVFWFWSGREPVRAEIAVHAENRLLCQRCTASAVNAENRRIAEYTCDAFAVHAENRLLWKIRSDAPSEC